jgi:hypothetical protein
MGRKYGLSASVSAGKIIFTFIVPLLVPLAVRSR